MLAGKTTSRDEGPSRCTKNPRSTPACAPTVRGLGLSSPMGRGSTSVVYLFGGERYRAKNMMVMQWHTEIMARHKGQGEFILVRPPKSKTLRLVLDCIALIVGDLRLGGRPCPPYIG
jgi:hypothetical protein